MSDAVHRARMIWDARETVRLTPTPVIVHRTLDLLDSAGLGRKRVLDTVLAATLHAVGVKRLATYNTADYAVFPFLEIVEPHG